MNNKRLICFSASLGALSMLAFITLTVPNMDLPHIYKPRIKTLKEGKGFSPNDSFHEVKDNIVNQTRILEKTKTKRKDKASPIFQRDVFDGSARSSLAIGTHNNTHKDNYFIYRCDERTMHFCGGWADRIRGIFVAYLIANLTGRTFKMEMIYGSCDIHRYILPNQIDWYQPIPFHHVVVVREKGNVAMMNMIDNNQFPNDVNIDFTAIRAMQSKYVYYKGNRELTQKFQALSRYKDQLSWMKNRTYNEMNNALFRHLFRPSPYLLNLVESFLNDNLQSDEKLVCAHVRVGKNPSNPKDTYQFIKFSALTNVWNFLQQQTSQNKSKIFLMTDSEYVLAMVKNQPFKEKIFLSPHKFIHIDRSSDASDQDKCEGLEKVILEQFVLMHCDVLMIGFSGLSRTASYIRDTDSGLFCFLLSGQVVPCKRNQVREMFHIRV